MGSIRPDAGKAFKYRISRVFLMVGAAGLPAAMRGALRDQLNESLRAISAFKPMASRLGSHPASHLFGAESSHSTLTIQNSKLNDGRAGRIRTDDPLPPRQVRYQTALQPVP